MMHQGNAYAWRILMLQADHTWGYNSTGEKASGSAFMPYAEPFGPDHGDEVTCILDLTVEPTVTFAKNGMLLGVVRFAWGVVVGREVAYMCQGDICQAGRYFSMSKALVVRCGMVRCGIYTQSVQGQHKGRREWASVGPCPGGPRLQLRRQTAEGKWAES